MKGIHHVEIKNREANFKFDLYRNITIVRGNSGTGKTTLYDMVSDYTRIGIESGVNISCDKRCVALVDIDWVNQINGIKDSIVFIDEGSRFISSHEFADIISKTDNYYVIFCRENLHDLPYSVEEIYEIKASGKYHTFKKMYHGNKYHYYNELKKKTNLVIVEDAKSGYQFFSNYYINKGIECISSKSNSNVFKLLKDSLLSKDKNIFVIADGAAFGAEIDRVLKLTNLGDFTLCLPESFEWLILKSGLIESVDLETILDNPSEFIECKDFFSWERFFEKYLIEETHGTIYQYTKKEINDVYLNIKNQVKIVEELNLERT